MLVVLRTGNSLRGFIKRSASIGDEEIVGLAIPTGDPIVYDLADDLSVQRRYYLREA